MVLILSSTHVHQNVFECSDLKFLSKTTEYISTLLYMEFYPVNQPSVNFSSSYYMRQSRLFCLFVW